MIKSPLETKQKMVGNVSRYVSNRDNLLRLYIYLAVASVSLLGIFGIYPLAKAVIEQTKVMNEMQKLNKDLIAKIISLDNYATQLESVKVEIPLLENYLPQTFDAPNYLVNFALAAGEASYSLDTFSPSQAEGSSVNISADVTGEGNVIKLLENIEKLNQVTQVNNANVGFEPNLTGIRLQVINFIMEK